MKASHSANPFKFGISVWLLIFSLAIAPSVFPALSPAVFQQRADNVVLLEELAFIRIPGKQSKWLRTTEWTDVIIVAKVVSVQRSQDGLEEGDLLTVLYRLNHTEIARQAREHRRKSGGMPGPQFTQLPSPPQPDEKGQFWAHLSLLEKSRGAGPGLPPAVLSSTRGRLFAPSGEQYTFQAPFE